MGTPPLVAPATESAGESLRILPVPYRAKPSVVVGHTERRPRAASHRKERKDGPGTGFLVRGKAAFTTAGPEFERVKARFSWARAALIISVLSAEQTL